MIQTEIKESEWKSFTELTIEPNVPYWAKLKNGNVVLTVHITTNHSSGWAKAFIDEDFNLKASGNDFYIMKDAKLQPALTC